MTPLNRITSAAFKYAPAASHSDPQAFRARMEQRRQQVQQQARVTPLKLENRK